MNVGKLIKHLQDNCKDSDEVVLLLYGCGQEYTEPVTKQRLKRDKDRGVLVVVADDN